MATHIVDLPSGRSVSVIVGKGQENMFTQGFASVVKILEGLPLQTPQPVKLTFSKPPLATSLSTTATSPNTSPSTATSHQQTYYKPPGTSLSTTTSVPTTTCLAISPNAISQQLTSYKPPGNSLSTSVTVPTITQSTTISAASTSHQRTSCNPPGTSLSTTSSAPTTPSQSTAVSATANFVGWDDVKTKSLLSIVRDKKDLLNVKNKKPVWGEIAKELSTKLNSHFTGNQCYDKYRKLKQLLRKHEDDRKKTGNSTPKDFKYMELYEIVGDDPTVQPIFTCDSAGNKSMAAASTASSSEEESPEPPPKAKRQKSRSRSSVMMDEVKEMFAESQKDLQDTLMTIHTENKELLSKLIDKL